jgi:TetR/AcrR family transcriptional repressor of mexJK operon
MTADPTRRGRGRPRDLEKRQAILDAANALFLERGIAATTIEAVAERAAVSKMTVYGHFQDKPALLHAVFERTIETIHLPNLSVGSDLTSSVERLIGFGERLVSFLTRPEIIRTGRLMAASADEYPVLAAAFYAAGPGAMLEKVAAFLKSMATSGLLSVKDPDLMAEQLIASWLGMSQLRQNLGVIGPPSGDAIAKRVRNATEMMVRACPTHALVAGRSKARSPS